MNLVLHYAPITCALVPYINLTEAGAAFEARPINLAKAQHFTPEYLALNPLHKVPALEIDGRILTENIAIQIWIARNFPNARLLPTEPLDEIRAIAVMSWCGSGMHPHLGRFFAPKRYCDTLDAAESVRRLATDHLLEYFQFADRSLDGREWFFDHFTAPDTYFFWCTRRAMQFEMPLSPFSNVRAHFERMLRRDSVRKLLEFEKEVLMNSA